MIVQRTKEERLLPEQILTFRKEKIKNIHLIKIIVLGK